MTTNTLELPRDLFLTDDDHVTTTRIVRPPAPRLAAIEARNLAALGRDRVFAVAMLCLTVLFALGIATH